MMKTKKKSRPQKGKKGFFQRLITSKKRFTADYLPFIKSLFPHILMIFVSCLYISLGLFSAAVLAALCINHENMPWFMYCYALVYFIGIIGLLAAEYLTKKDWHFIPYIGLTTLVNLAFALFFYPQMLFNFFDKLLPQTLLLTTGIFVFYITDYNPLTSQKRNKTNKKD